MNKDNKTCDFGGCSYPTEYLFYPDAKRNAFLSVALCEKHRDEMNKLRSPKDNAYRFASSFVTQSLG